MQQHPVPQNVTQYQFRLVGDMTLKQFLELLGGIVLAYLFYASNLIFIFKWPLAIMSIIAGFGLAFFPIEDRPLDQWITNFLKSIYSPTRFIWKKSNKVPRVFTFEPHAIIETVTATKTVKAPSLADLSPKAGSDVSDEERVKLNVLDAMLAKMPTSKNLNGIPPAAGSPATRPSITLHKLKPLTVVGSSTVFKSAPRPAPALQPVTINLNEKLTVPTSQPTAVDKPVASPPVVKTPNNVIFAKPTIALTKPVAPSVAPATIRLPAAPTSPNLVVGMVVDKEGKIIENAIVQIVTGDGIPARAIKTNSLGQFYTSTPLSRGAYTIETEKEGLSFPPNKLIIEDKIVSPLLVKAN